MAKTIEARAVISAADRTGAAFQNVANKIKGVAQSAKALEKVRPMFGWGETFQREMDRLKLAPREIDAVRRSWENMQRSMTRSSASGYFGGIERWKNHTLSSLRAVRAEQDAVARSHRGMLRSGARFAIGALGIGGGAYMVNRAARAGGRAAADLAREDARDYLAGLTPGQTEAIKTRALDLSARYPSVDASGMHRQLREAASSMRSVDKAIELGDTIGSGLVVLQSLKGKDQALEEAQRFFKALDVLGRNLEAGQVRNMWNAYVKALGVEGSDLNMADVFQLAKRARLAGGGLSDEFLMTIAPGIIQDMGASEVGAALASSIGQLVGGKAPKKAMTLQRQYGLRDKQGRFIDQAKFIANPHRFTWENLIPALQRRGVDIESEDQVIAAVSKLFPNQRTADLIGKLILQRRQYQGKVEQYGRAPGLEGADVLRQKDPYVAGAGVIAQLRNLIGTLADPHMEKASGVLGGIADALARLSKAAAENPQLNTTLGAAGLLGGAAATAGGVWAGAKALRWLYGVKGGADALATGLAGAEAAALGGATGGASAAALSRWTMLGRLLPWLGGALSIATTPDMLLKAPTGQSWDEAIRQEIERRKAADDAAGPSRRAGDAARAREAYRAQFDEDRARLGLPALQAPATAPAASRGFTLEDIRGALQGSEIKARVDGPVTAELHGTAEVSGETRVQVEVTTSSELLRIVDGLKRTAAQLRGALRADGPGSTGKSMNEAAPYSAP